MKVDYTYRVRIEHRPGRLAEVAKTIADAGGLVGDVTTVKLTRSFSLREITVEVEDAERADELRDAIAGLEGVEVEEYHDRALALHEGGKLTIEPVRPVRTVQDMRDVYTPGVARACRAISDDPDEARRLTMIGHTVAICTNGTRVLGLGDIGPLAAMPVMEGKAVFYRQLAGISAMPILIDTRDPEEFVETVVRIAPTFGGIHLEDISTPDCFEIEPALIDRLDQPVMHDDVHGTAVVALAAVMAACRRVDIELSDVTVGQLGLGAAGYGIAGLMADAGADRVIAFDPNEEAHDHARGRGVDIVDDEDTVLREARIVVAATGRPHSIDPSKVREGQIVLALSNPDPEIDPEDASRAGAAFASDGSSVNNVLGYPGMFRGALEARAGDIDTEMKLAAARALAGFATEDDGDRGSELLPDPLDPAVHECVATAVRNAARARA